MSGRPAHDLSGVTRGEWTAIARVGTDPRTRHAVWQVRHACGGSDLMSTQRFNATPQPTYCEKCRPLIGPGSVKKALTSF